MTESSPFLTPNGTPLHSSSDGFLTPWSDVLLEELRAAIELNPPPGITKSYGYTQQIPSRKLVRKKSRVLWLAIFIIVAVSWILKDGFQTKRKVSQDDETDMKLKLAGLQFINASHPEIRYVGRWVATADGSHWDGSFPGVYFDFTVNGTSTLFLALYNRAHQDQTPAIKRSMIASLNFLPFANTSHASPISLLARVDDNEYIVLPNVTSIVPIRDGNLDPSRQHEIRVIAPMVGGENTEILQVEGFWIDERGQLLPIDRNRVEVNDFLEKQQTKKLVGMSSSKRKMLEIVTDMPGAMAGRDRRKNVGTTRGILGGVMGWEYLLGEMFGADHVMVGMEGMCLIQDCKGGKGAPAGLVDVFFQSGPAGSEQYEHPWLFQQYTPDVMVINIGSSDWESFQAYNEEYNKTIWELGIGFEETYVSMIKAIRTLAYPKYTASSVDSSRYTKPQQSAIAGVPIFAMRPFRGQLEQATHSVVDRLRMEGDNNVFWLDTSGWLNSEIDVERKAEDQDFFLDEASTRKQWHLTERGNQRVAILLHMHVCQYLAVEVDKCAFLPPEVYQGKAMDPEAMQFEDFMQEEKERKLKKMFWD